MRLIFFAALFCLISFVSNSQNLTGYSSKEIIDYMRINRKDMNRETVKNSSYSYLKYSDSNDTQTILFFLTSDSICKSIRTICNNSIRDEKIRELDSGFSKAGANRWTDRKNGKTFDIKLVEDDWSFTITIEQRN